MRFINRFPVKLALIFLVLISLVGVGSVFIALGMFERRQVEIDQRLNRPVAASMAAEIQPFVSAPGDDQEVGSVMHYMMVMNPSVEIYLLDGEGAILDYFASPGPEVQLQQVDLRPIQAFVDGAQELPILGDNPRQPGRRHHFSAAPIDLAQGEQGYLYVILRSSEYDQASMTLQRRYLLQALQTSMLVTIPLVAVLGLLVFFLATQRLQQLAQTVRDFGEGDYGVRSAIRSDDEIGDLARSFNAMAETIVGDVQRLEHADRERRELIANISHDLRNPLATIQGYLETLSQKDSDLSSADRNRYYDILLSTTKVLPRLVEDLFELSKLEAPDMKPPMERFALSELVQDVGMQWKSRAADLGIALTVSEPAGLHMVYGNVGLVERALTNLVRNALSHTPAGGAVSLAAKQQGGWVRVEVADTGVGIREEDRNRVFDRFYIGDASRSRARRGSGLGLAICKRIIELHGGRIGVTSTPGEGSTFFFDMPVEGVTES